MILFFKSKTTAIKQIISDFFERFGISGAALILTVEFIWIASVVVPVLVVISFLFNATKAWMAVLPGFLGAFTFLIVLTIGGLAATLPSVYLGKWRESIWQWMERRHPVLESRQPAQRPAPLFPHGLDIQDAD